MSESRDPAQRAIPSWVVIPVGVLLVVLGLVLFTHAQTQGLFQAADHMDPMTSQQGRDDGAIILGASMIGLGLTTMVVHMSPLRRRDRILPALVLGPTLALLIASHFSIFTNGTTLPDENMLVVHNSFFFNDTNATIPITTATLAFATFVTLVIAGISFMALITPQMLHGQFLRPTTLHAHRTRLFLVTLLLLGAGGAFARQFFAFSEFTSGPGQSLVTLLYIFMGAGTALLLALMAWRTIHLLWVPKIHRGEIHRLDRFWLMYRLETIVVSGLLLLSSWTLILVPVYVPTLGTDPVFAMSSHGVTWAFLIVLVAYVLHRRWARFLQHHLTTADRRHPRPKEDLLVPLGVTIVTFWTTGAFIAPLLSDSPLVQYTARFLSIVVLAPLLAVFFTHRLRPIRAPSASIPILMFSWVLFSLLTGIMLWGIGNSVTVGYSNTAGMIGQDGRLLDPQSAGIRLLASLLLLIPSIVAIGLLVRGKVTSSRSFPMIVAAGSFLLAMHAMLTINPVSRFNPFLDQNDVVIAFWLFTLPGDMDVLLISLLVGSLMAFALITTRQTLMNGVRELTPGFRPVWAWVLEPSTYKPQVQGIHAALRSLWRKQDRTTSLRK